MFYICFSTKFVLLRVCRNCSAKRTPLSCRSIKPTCHRQPFLSAISQLLFVFCWIIIESTARILSCMQLIYRHHLPTVKAKTSYQSPAEGLSCHYCSPTSNFNLICRHHHHRPTVTAVLSVLLEVHHATIVVHPLLPSCSKNSNLFLCIHSFFETTLLVSRNFQGSKTSFSQPSHPPTPFFLKGQIPSNKSCFTPKRKDGMAASNRATKRARQDWVPN